MLKEQKRDENFFLSLYAFPPKGALGYEAGRDEMDVSENESMQSAKHRG